MALKSPSNEHQAEFFSGGSNPRRRAQQEEIAAEHRRAVVEERVDSSTRGNVAMSVMKNRKQSQKMAREFGAGRIKASHNAGILSNDISSLLKEFEKEGNAFNDTAR